MATIPVIIKHGGKRYNVDLDPSATGEDFKAQLFSLTGVEPDRQKILVKGGQLKDDQDLSKLGAKPGQAFMMMGTPASGGVASIEKPKEKIRFIEDMTEAEVAQSDGAIPAGLQNLGNTCYINSTLQTFRAIPELQQELLQYKPSPSAGAMSAASLAQHGLAGLGSATDLTASLRDLYKQMSETQTGFPPIMFLNAFRTTYPQFAEMTNTPHGRGYAQQDAEEAWSQLTSTLRQKLKITDGDKASESGDTAAQISFIDKYMSGKFETVTTCDDQAAKDAGEEPVTQEEAFFKLNCHISQSVNHLRDGMIAALSDTYEKNSPTLGRDVPYTKVSRIARLPKYLPVHFVRFFWRRDINKKTKILRKVTFQHELDCVEYCTDELKSKLIPVRDKVRELRKEEVDVERSRKRQRLMEKAAAMAGNSADTQETDKKAANGKQDKASADPNVPDIEFKTDAQIEAERAAQILNAKKELLAVVNPDLVKDTGANQTGLYELRGVVTHQGASSDSGHYIAYVKKEGKKDPVTGKRGAEDGSWWQFNDDKVSEVDAEKIEGLAGGGESASALILLYRAVELPNIDEEK